MDAIICTACRITLACQEDCRAHYKTDFHTYNLKRKYVNLEPVSKTIYDAKVKESEFLILSEDKNIKCSCCNQSFATPKALNKHLRSKQNVSETFVVDPLLTCLFCNQVKSSIKLNLEHMQISHGFFIPNAEFVKNFENLLRYLHKKIRETLLCLYCNNHQGHNFKSAASVQQHMIDKQHCFLNIDEDKLEFQEHYINEDDKSFDIIDNDEIMIDHYVDLGSQSSETCSYSLLSSSHSNINAEITRFGELRLESGKIIGNKMYSRYYKQCYKPIPERKQKLLAVVSEEGPRKQVEKNIPRANVLDTRKNSLKIGLKGNIIQHHLRVQI